MFKMGKEKYLKDVESLFKKSGVVNYNSIERIVRNKKNVKSYTKQLTRNLIKQGKIKRLTKGYYTIYDYSSLAVFCFKPAYLGLQDALSVYNLWEQETIPVIITTSKIRPGIRKILGSNVLIRRIEKKYFFGITYRQEDLQGRTIALPYSDIEKTFIDMIYFKEKIIPETLHVFKKRVDRKKLENYLKRYPKRTRKIVLSHLIRQ